MTAWECAQTGWGKRGIMTHPTPISDLTPAVRVGTPDASFPDVGQWQEMNNLSK